MTKRSYVELSVVLVTLAVALSLDPGSRSYALFAWLLLVAAIALAELVRRVESAIPVSPDLLVEDDPQRRRLPKQLDELERDVAEALHTASARRLVPLLRGVAATRLARDHGIDLDRRPERAAALLGDGPLRRIVQARRKGEAAPGTPLRLQGLRELVDELERL